MPMPIFHIYAVSFALVFGFCFGFGVSNKLDNVQIERLENAIDKQKTEAKSALNVAVIRVDAAEAKALETNVNLEKAHDSAIKTINTYRDLLATARLPDPGHRPHRANALPAGANTGITKTEPEPGELSAELSGFLRQEVYRADTVAVYAAQCHQFVINNCGIAP